MKPNDTNNLQTVSAFHEEPSVWWNISQSRLHSLPPASHSLQCAQQWCATLQCRTCDITYSPVLNTWHCTSSQQQQQARPSVIMTVAMAAAVAVAATRTRTIRNHKLIWEEVTLQKPHSPYISCCTASLPPKFAPSCWGADTWYLGPTRLTNGISSSQLFLQNSWLQTDRQTDGQADRMQKELGLY